MNKLTGTGETEEQVKMANDILHSGGRYFFIILIY